jgi:hypothetical protein
MRQAWTITLIFLVFIAVGCSGGSLMTREKGAGIGAFGGPPLEVLSEQPWVIREQVPASTVRSGSAPAC